MARKRGLTYGKNFFYCDFDNLHAMRNHGFQITTILQDYHTMGTRGIAALRTIGQEKIQEFVPHRVAGLIETL